jgi:hypothetical protein
VRALFDVPTVAELAERIQTIIWATQGKSTGIKGVDRTEIKL